ncbi:hypothetical protein GOBAR_AA22429 [Gossypium barbadense]|uniref:Uncharacterized protein n=1 Tax=Gossypium barbadense TaxID=3634 RepID=A0A2P5X4H1_GOSBA|nr:hypothetical protein GOBAR_AA22429 [Gossypium barbadense]
MCGHYYYLEFPKRMKSFLLAFVSDEPNPVSGSTHLSPKSHCCKHKQAKVFNFPSMLLANRLKTQKTPYAFQQALGPDSPSKPTKASRFSTIGPE